MPVFLLKQEQEELNKFIAMSQQEQDVLIANILKSIKLPFGNIFGPLFNMFDGIPKFEENDEESNPIKNRIRIEDAIENNVDEISEH